MKSPISIHDLRNGDPGRDRAILDLLHLHQIGLAPGHPHVRTLMLLWGISQPQVSRRMTAIRELGVLWVEAGHGQYRLIERHEERCSRDRWEAIREAIRSQLGTTFNASA